MKSIQGYEDRIRFLENQLKKKCEEVEQLKSAFLNNVSHEVRTPMNAIMGFSCLLQDHDISESERLMFIDGIMNSSKSLLKIVDNFMYAARLDSNDIDFNPQTVCAEKIIDDLYETYSKERSPHVELRINNSPDSIQMNTDPEKLKMILCNLLDNAFKFTERGFIEFGYQKCALNKVEFFVQDTGIGITEDKMGQIFEQFNQLEKRRSKKYNGMGIGLTISKKMAELMEGDLKVESDTEKGTIFTIVLPIDHKNIKLMNNTQRVRGLSTAEDATATQNPAVIKSIEKKFSVHSK